MREFVSSCELSMSEKPKPRSEPVMGMGMKVGCVFFNSDEKLLSLLELPVNLDAE